MFHTAPLAVGLSFPHWDMFAPDAASSSGSRYSHSPRSLQMRALIRPVWRQRPSGVRVTPSLEAICLPVSQPASSKRCLRLLSLCEKRNPVDAGRIERITRAGAHAALVEQVGSLRVGVLVQARVDLSAHLFVRDA